MFSFFLFLSYTPWIKVNFLVRLPVPYTISLITRPLLCLLLPTKRIHHGNISSSETNRAIIPPSFTAAKPPLHFFFFSFAEAHFDRGCKNRTLQRTIARWGSVSEGRPDSGSSTPLAPPTELSVTGGLEGPAGLLPGNDLITRVTWGYCLPCTNHWQV